MRRVLTALVLAGALLAACGDDGGDDAAGLEADVDDLGLVTTSSIDDGTNVSSSAGDALFAYERHEGSGADVVWFVHGECTEGGVPGEVTVVPAVSSAIALEDLGEGLYSFAFGVAPGTDLSDGGVLSGVLVEVGIPEDLGQDGNRSMRGVCG